MQWLLNLWWRTEVCLLGLNSSFPFYNWTSFINWTKNVLIEWLTIHSIHSRQTWLHSVIAAAICLYIPDFEIYTFNTRAAIIITRGSSKPSSNIVNQRALSDSISCTEINTPPEGAVDAFYTGVLRQRACHLIVLYCGVHAAWNLNTVSTIVCSVYTVSM